MEAKHYQDMNSALITVTRRQYVHVGSTPALPKARLAMLAKVTVINAEFMLPELTGQQ